tara:strand:- start:193 stop:378 length:186 start_codon:yes stop_codon:yes gene_type:complete
LLLGYVTTTVLIKDMVTLYGDGVMITLFKAKEISQILMIKYLLEKEELEIEQFHSCIVIFL